MFPSVQTLQISEQFVLTSSICKNMKQEELDAKKAVMEKRSMLKPQMPIEYHAFSEAEILARDRGSLSDSETEREVELSDEESSTDISPSCSEESYESFTDEEPTDKEVACEMLGSDSVKDCSFSNETETVVFDHGLMKENLFKEEVLVVAHDGGKTAELLVDHSEHHSSFPASDSPKKTLANGDAFKKTRSSPSRTSDCSSRSPSRECCSRENVHFVRSDTLIGENENFEIPSEASIRSLAVREGKVVHSIFGNTAVTHQSITRTSQNDVEQAGSHSLKEKVKRHWKGERCAEDEGAAKNDPKSASEKIRLRIRTTSSHQKVRGVLED